MLKFFQTLINLAGPEFEPSKIILNKTRYWELLKRWLEPVSTLPTKWKLCYRATHHGWSSSTFHSQCNGLGPSVTFIRVGEYIFGGYTDRNWRKYSITNVIWSAFFFSTEISKMQRKVLNCSRRTVKKKKKKYQSFMLIWQRNVWIRYYSRVSKRKALPWWTLVVCMKRRSEFRKRHTLHALTGMAGALRLWSILNIIFKICVLSSKFLPVSSSGLRLVRTFCPHWCFPVFICCFLSSTWINAYRGT